MLLRVLAYFVPFAINFLSGGFFFITSYRFAEAKCPALIVGGAVAAWGVAYCLTTLFIGKLVKNSNALWFILAGGVLLSLTSSGFIIFFEHIYWQFYFLVLAGLGAALFCTPFQLFAKKIESGKKSAGVVSATAFYTLTWSVGFASGPLAFARLSPITGFFITLVLALMVTLSVIIIALLVRGKNAAELPAEEQSTGTSVKFTDKTFSRLAVLGWIVGSAATIAVCQVRSMWPKLGEDLNVSRDHIAYVLAMVSYVQALTALLLCKSKCWMWKRLPALLICCSGVLAMMLFAFSCKVWGFYLAALAYGIYSGCMYFCLVYHSLAHPKKSAFFVAGNEIVVGITSMLSPLIGGMLADAFKFTGAAFVFAAVLIVAAFMAQLWMLLPHKLVEEKEV